MGGCRCSYKDCTVKTDGKTHLFHYPVFDKVRCHKWLTNSRKLEFLNLTVAQLKNRVVCQHHFKPECFMNFMHDKLTFDAVPTEDGPFCTPTFGYGDSIEPQSYIALEDIDDEFYLNKAQVNFSKKYVDFLTNGDISDTNQISQNEEKTNKTSLHLNSYYKQDNNIKDKVDFEVEIDMIKLFDSPDPNKIALHQKLPKENKSCIQKDPSNHGATKANKIKIISEKKICDPITVSELKPISPSNILAPRSTRKIIKSATKMDQFNFIQIPPIEPAKENVASVFLKNDVDTNVPILLDISPTLEKKQAVPTKQTVNLSSISKPVLAPERIASIREKRKFNKRVASEAGLSNLVNKQAKVENKTQDILNHTQQILNHDQNILNHSKTQTSNLSMYDFNRLEARLSKMEDILTHKINQNSQNIKDIKDAVSSKSIKKSVASTQTPISDEGYKKYLFKELSKFLTTNVKNLVYEELFLNKFVEVNNDGAELQRRRRRF